MKALSVRAPWWWFILHAVKDIENRDWPTNFRGTVYLHASSWYSRVGIALAIEVIIDILAKIPGCPEYVLREDDIRPFLGHIVGKVDVVGCVRESDSPWFFGEYGFVLANPVAFSKPIPCKGALGFFTVPADVQEAIEEMECAA